jgi:3-dehydroquinate dehydratase-2
MKFLVLHGPNLNLLGEREPEIYGTTTLSQLNRKLVEFAKKHGVELRIRQSNHEGELIDLLHDNRTWANGVVFNPAAYTHYSYALRDAVAAIGLPTIEVHLSDIHRREKFRKISVIAPSCVSQVSGLGWRSYTRGIELLIELLNKKRKEKKHAR